MKLKLLSIAGALMTISVSCGSIDTPKPEESTTDAFSASNKYKREVVWTFPYFWEEDDLVYKDPVELCWYFASRPAMPEELAKDRSKLKDLPHPDDFIEFTPQKSINTDNEPKKNVTNSDSIATLAETSSKQPESATSSMTPTFDDATLRELAKVFSLPISGLSVAKGSKINSTPVSLTRVNDEAMKKASITFLPSAILGGVLVITVGMSGKHLFTRLIRSLSITDQLDESIVRSKTMLRNQWAGHLANAKFWFLDLANDLGPGVLGLWVADQTVVKTWASMRNVSNSSRHTLNGLNQEISYSRMSELVSSIKKAEISASEEKKQYGNNKVCPDVKQSIKLYYKHHVQSSGGTL